MFGRINRVFLFVIVVLLIGCSGNEISDIPEIPQEISINLSKTVIEVDTAAGSTEIVLKANCAWSASSDVSWLSVKPVEGTGDAVLNCSWTSNVNPQQRTASVVVQSGQVKKTISIVQAGDGGTKPQVMSCCGVVGNSLNNENSYFEISFDQPVTIESIYTEKFYIDLEPVYSNNRKTIQQKFKNAALGLDLTCTVKVRNDKGVSSTINVKIPFYQKKYTPEGELMFMLLSEDEQSVWVSLAQPNKVVQLSLDDGHVIHDIEMPFAPGNICYNPYNKKIYVMPSNGYYLYGYSNQLCVINPQNGRIDETISFDPSPDAHPQYPTIYPYELQFTNNGFGIVLLRANGSSQLEWRYIDSADHHKQSLSGYSWAEKQFEHLYRSYDGRKIWANPYPRLYTTIYSISREESTPKEYKIAPKFNSDKYFAGGSMMDMQFSPMSNKVFISTAPGSECVIDLDTDSYSEVIEAEARNSKAAWDRSSSGHSLVYHVCSIGNFLLLLDMDRGEPIFFCYQDWNSTLCDIYHLPATDQLIVATSKGIYLIDASVMK